MRSRSVVLLVLALAGVALVGSCGGDGADKVSAPLTEADGPSRLAERSGSATGALGDKAGDLAVASGGGAGSDAGPAPAGLVAQVRPSGDRELIYTADLLVRVKDPVDAAAKAGNVARDAGGLVFSRRTSADHESTLVLRVPPGRLDAVLADLADLGDEDARNVEADDVTERVVDLEARITTARASVERLRGLIAEAKTVPEVVSVEAELTKRETELETLVGQQRQLEDQVGLATIHLTLRERSEAAPSSDIPSFLDGFRTGAAALVNALQVAATVTGFALPFLGVLLVLGLPLWAAWRRRRTPPEALVAEP